MWLKRMLIVSALVSLIKVGEQQRKLFRSKVIKPSCWSGLTYGRACLSFWKDYFFGHVQCILVIM